MKPLPAHFALAFASLTLALSSPALAGPVIGLQTDYAVTTPENAGPDGLGITGRVGYGLDVGVLEVVPELEVSKFSDAWIPKLGGRVMIGKGVEPGLFGHVLLPMWRQAEPLRGFDAGATLDFTAAPMVDFGLHGGALVLDGVEARQVTPFFGVHASVSF